MINCLAYALRFWKVNPEYKLYYNSDHVINSPNWAPSIQGGNYLTAEEFGYNYFSSAFKELLNEEEKVLLKEYFNEKV
jgi:hypothetical protein